MCVGGGGTSAGGRDGAMRNTERGVVMILEER